MGHGTSNGSILAARRARGFARSEGRGQWQPHPTGQRGGCHRPRCRVFGLSVAFQLTGHREFHPRPRRGALLSRFAKPRPSCSPALTSGRLHGATLGERSGTIIRPAAEGGDWAELGEGRATPPRPPPPPSRGEEDAPRVSAAFWRRPKPLTIAEALTRSARQVGVSARDAAGCGFTGAHPPALASAPLGKCPCADGHPRLRELLFANGA